MRVGGLRLQYSSRNINFIIIQLFLVGIMDTDITILSTNSQTFHQEEISLRVVENRDKKICMIIPDIL